MAELLEPLAIDENGSNSRNSIPSRNSHSSTPSVASTDGQSLLSPLRRKRFDDRSQSRTSIQLRAHTASPNTQRPHVLRATSSEGVQSFVKWVETKHISKVINSEDFINRFGAPQLIQLSQHHIAVGTERGLVVAFNYKQEPDFVLVPRKSDTVSTDEQPISQVCCISFSSDAFFAAAGYSDGSVAVWNLGDGPPTSRFDVLYADGVIQPITLEQRFRRNMQGHLKDVPVIKVNFVGDQDQQLVSSDLSGLVFFHRGFKRFLRKYYTSQKLLGKNDTNSADTAGKFTIHDSQVLPFGTSEQITDTLGLLAVINKNILVIVSVRSLDNPDVPYPVSQYKCSRPKSVAGDDAQVTYGGSLKILRHRLVMLVNSHSASQRTILSGRCLKWADRLMDFLAQSEFESALSMAFEYYVSEDYGQLVLHGLPHNRNERHAVVSPILKRVMVESVEPLFSSQDNTSRSQSNLELFFRLVSILSKNGLVNDDLLHILDEIYDRFEDRKLFFDMLEEYIISSEIKNLSPILFKGLIENYAASDKRELLAEIICLLDMSTLNIDLALNLCKAFHLRECRIYIWNEMLKDYTTPLVTLINEIESNNSEHDDLLIVFTYMSYILTGRSYPSDKILDSSVEVYARNSICEILFSIGPYTWPKDSEKVLLGSSSDKIFPYLTFFLEFDTFETLVTINEFFENPSLNDEIEGPLTRQYIIEALLDIFGANEALQKGESQTHLAIFIARNYPKYFQFIRLSESVLQETVDVLCKNKDPDLHEDCELALESLLSVYEVESDAHLLEQMRAAGFYDVLFKISKSRGEFTQAMEMWLAKHQESSSETSKNVTVLADMLKSTFQSENQNTTERIRLTQFIEEHYEDLISSNSDDMVVLSNTFHPELNLIVLKCEDKSLALRYLVSFFERTVNSNLDSVSLPLLVRYFELLSEDKELPMKNLVVKYLSSLENHKPEKDAIKTVLKDAKAFESLAVILSNDGEHDAAVDELWNAIEALQTTDGDLKEEDYETISSYLARTIRIGEEARKESLWTSLVEKFVVMSERTEDERLHDILNESIYKCFRAIEDREAGKDGKSTFTNVFNRVLEVAKVANLRETLQDILTSYFFESEIHTITVGKINQRISKYMDTIKEEELLGWLVNNKQCTSCGKVMWGGEMSERHTWAWEERQKSKVFLSEGSFDKEKFSDCDLYLFKCSHGYHKKCLEHIGGNKRCVICCPE
ncbi:hypothetical protein CXQ85_002215 [Candidozyma haemuli]|uniref:Vacuolar protein sorting-associated protein 8 central domain-containing protein n=1 Tax=Candidozyma haemuli TaxID=45357 RepID=A0A2V1AQC6_9ASCO|nr:hypothetical protein CXQ85_002215 [[Candida] haemuloni]PVH20427.1 hypothetical protein CXQ85_002215 [[Candida] haemuloni]